MSGVGRRRRRDRRRRRRVAGVAGRYINFKESVTEAIYSMRGAIRRQL